jgi:hypothetical protein
MTRSCDRVLLGPYSGPIMTKAHCSCLQSETAQPACAERHHN